MKEPNILYKRLLLCPLIILLFSIDVFSCDRKALLDYAKKYTTEESWWNKKYDFYGATAKNGSDCANFVSQALIACCYSQSFISWPGADKRRWTLPSTRDLGKLLQGISVYTKITKNDKPPKDLQSGDIIILGDLISKTGSRHSVIVTSTKTNSSGDIVEIKFAAHTSSRYDRALYVANKGWNTWFNMAKYNNTINVYQIKPSPFPYGETHNGPPTEDGVRIRIGTHYEKDDLERIKPAKVSIPRIITAKDPNIMYGPEGQVVPGQTMTYTVEFENIGQGIAYGVYVTDIFSEYLDDSNIAVKDFYSIDYNTNIVTPVTYPYSYDSRTKTLSVLIDELGSKKGGKFTVELKLKADTPQGTVISNHATVYFPSVPETTPTNSIISVVPSNSQIMYTGDTAARYSDYALFQSSLTSASEILSGKTLIYSIGQSSYAAMTNFDGIAYSYQPISLAPG